MSNSRRSGARIMASLIMLLGSLAYIMVLAVINGSLGFVCAMGVTLFGAVGIAKAMGEAVALSFGWIIALAIGCGIMRGLLRYLEQYGNHYIAFRLLAVLRDKIFGALRTLCPAKLESKQKGSIIAMITSDIETLEVFYAHTISPICIAVVVSLAVFIFVGNPVGTGAYYIAEGDYIEGSSITATIRDNYDETLKKEMFSGESIENISVILMSNEDVLINALNDGNVDFMLNSVTPAKTYAVENNPSYSNVDISSVTSETVTTLLFNVGLYGAFKEGSFDGYSYEIRKSISLCLDQQMLIDDVLHGKGVQVGDGLVQDYFAHAYVDENGGYVYHKTDIEAANVLLDTTPYKMNENGSRGITLTVFATPDNEITVKAIATQLEQIGIAIEYEQATATYSEDIKQQNNADFDMIINRVTYNSDKLLMFNARYGVYPATGSVRLFNYSGIIDETLIEMMKEMELCSDTNEQYEKCRQVQKYIADLAVEIPLYSESTITFYSDSKWQGWTEAEGLSIWNSYTTRYLQKAQ